MVLWVKFCHGHRKMERVGLATSGGIGSLLIDIARSQGFFEDRGIQLVVHETSLSSDALDQLSSTGVELAVSSEAPIVKKTFAGEKIKILATLYSTSSDIKIVARKDHGIRSAEDLRGKRVGETGASAPEYYLASFLLQFGLRLEDVSVVHKKSSELLGDLKHGKIDAVALGEPQAYRLKDGLGSKGIVLPDGALYHDSFNLVARDGWLTSHSKTAVHFLEALHLAENYEIDHPGEVAALVSAQAGAQGVERQRLEGSSSLRLDESLIVSLEERSRWMIEHREVSLLTKMPNFLELIYLPALKSVKPDGIGVIH